MIRDAKYVTTGLPRQYLGNPLIECLPSIQPSEAVMKTLVNKPDISLGESRQLPPHIRLHDLAELESLFVPQPAFATFESELGIMLRRGLKSRHPFLAETQRYLNEIREQMRIQHSFENPLAGSYLITGVSGKGKTRGIRTVLGTYPQTIRHLAYSGKRFFQMQVVWLSVDAPVSGSIKGLLLRLFVALDKALGLEGSGSYFHQYSRSRMPYDQQIENFSQAAASHFVGVIHIDDLQRVWEANASQRDIIYSFIIQLSNVAKIPLVLSGTHKMTRLLAGSLEAARRTVSAGALDLPIPSNSSDVFFRTLVKALFKYQWTDNPLALNEAMYEKLFYWTQGLPALVVAMYMQGQKIALRNGGKTFELTHIERAYQSLNILHPALAALRKRDRHCLSRYQDLLPSRIQMHKVLKEAAGEKLDAAALMEIAMEEI